MEVGEDRAGGQGKGCGQGMGPARHLLGWERRQCNFPTRSRPQQAPPLLAAVSQGSATGALIRVLPAVTEMGRGLWGGASFDWPPPELWVLQEAR